MYSEKQLFSYKGSYQLNHFDVYWMSLNHLATRKVLKNLKSVSHEWLCGYLADFLYFIKSGIFSFTYILILCFEKALFCSDIGEEIFLTADLSSTLATAPC